MIFDTIFENNTAKYGMDIASYPILIKSLNDHQNKLKLENIASGQPITSNFDVGVYDYEGQLCSLESNAKIFIIPESFSGNIVKGINERALKNGTANFSGVIFTTNDFNNEQEFSIITQAINQNVYENSF
jgi:hypothetical protein